MKLRYRLVCLAILTLLATAAHGQVISDGAPNIDDGRLYAWYDAIDFGTAEDSIWPNAQGENERSIFSGFGPDGASLTLIEMDNGLPAVEFFDVVTWSDSFGVVEDGFTVFVTANVRDPAFAYFFTGNQPGGGAEVNANFQADDFDVWTMKGEEGRILTAEVEPDVLQIHSFTFGEDGMGRHHIGGELVGEGEIGFASLQNIVIGGRQNGHQRATIDFAEILIYEEELPEADRQAVEIYLDTKYFGGGPLVPGDFDGDGELTAADIDLLTSAVNSGSNDPNFDVDGDGAVAGADRVMWVNELKNTYMGDSNLDGQFDSGDLVFTFTAGQYEDAEDMNSTWATGDWDGNGDFDSADFVTAFSAGGYDQGPRTATASAVPEPSSLSLILLGLLAVYRRKS